MKSFIVWKSNRDAPLKYIMVGHKVTGNSGRQYTIIREIGRGGFGIVYEAKIRIKAKKSYALKTIFPLSDTNAQISFEKEIQSTLGLNHRNLLEITDHGICTVDNHQALFTISEYCPNGDFRKLLDSYANNWPGDLKVSSDFEQILAGLSTLHTKTIHRDLKPENIFLSGKTLKIGDFGLAKFVDEATRTLTFKGFGTPLYMAPEIWAGKHATAASDLYAVGVILFEAFVGNPPFASSDIQELRDMHLYTPAPRAKSSNPDIPEKIDSVIKKLLNKGPEQRYQTADDTLNALKDNLKPKDPNIADLASRLKQHHDKAEQQQLERKRAHTLQEDNLSRNKYMEKELLALFNSVVDDINSQLEETQILNINTQAGKEYRFRERSLFIHFFNPGEIFTNPEVPGRMDILRDKHVVHGGFVEIREGGQDHEGWNLVLVCSPQDPYGQWIIVETRPAVGINTSNQYEPMATQARLFADNLACHWMHTMHIFNLKDKPLEKDNVLDIFQVFIP